jgi:NADPH:quinone reductase-like Zn-dependent oxidoreductase
MALINYEIEVKAAALTSYDLLYTRNKFRIFSGTVLSCDSYSLLYSQGSQVIGYAPLMHVRLRIEENMMIATVPEEYLTTKPADISHENSVLGLATVLRTLNALHYSISVLQNESILILGSSDQVPIQVSMSLGLNVYYYGKEDYKLKAIKVSELPESILTETGGLGVNYILDFNAFHDSNSKKNILDCLGIRGKWATSNQNLQIDPPESYQLFMRNASICWFNEDIWTHSGTDHGKFLHLINTALKYLKEGIEIRPSKTFFLTELDTAYLEKNELILLKSIG